MVEMRIKIVSPDEYKLYLKKELSREVKDDKKLQILIDNMYITFQDGIKFGQGKLEVEVDEII
jgi:hypothetical protein